VTVAVLITLLGFLLTLSYCAYSNRRGKGYGEEPLPGNKTKFGVDLSTDGEQSGGANNPMYFISDADRDNEDEPTEGGNSVNEKDRKGFLSHIGTSQSLKEGDVEAFLTF